MPRLPRRLIFAAAKHHDQQLLVPSESLISVLSCTPVRPFELFGPGVMWYISHEVAHPP